MYGPPRMAERHLDWPYICGVCGKNHPTLHCIPKNQVVRTEPLLVLWCDFHIRWGNNFIELNTCGSRLQGMHLKFRWMKTKPFQCWIGNLSFLKQHQCVWKTKTKSRMMRGPWFLSHLTQRNKPTYRRRVVRSWLRTNGDVVGWTI